MSKLNSKTVPELKKLAAKKGVEGFEEMLKPELVAALEVPEAPEELKPNTDTEDEGEGEKAPTAPGERDSEGKSEEVQDYVSPMVAGMKESHAPLGSKSAKMRDHLARQRKVRIFIPLDQGEPFGSTKSVILNGYQFWIKKNVYVNVPEQVADIIAQALNQEVMVVNENPMRLTGEEKELQK